VSQKPKGEVYKLLFNNSTQNQKGESFGYVDVSAVREKEGRGALKRTQGQEKSAAQKRMEQQR